MFEKGEETGRLPRLYEAGRLYTLNPSQVGP
jgi:hypothetical protein